MYSKILVPIAMNDLESAAKALDAAAAQAKAFGGDIIVMTLQMSDRDEARPVPDAAAMRFKDFVEAESKRVGRPLSGAFRQGDRLGAEVLEIVEELGVDLVVMRTHDPGWLDYLFGSRSTSVALHAPCSVLIVR